jgi:sugar lactone lactonase YvrE
VERSYFTSIAVGEKDIFVADAGMRVVWRLDTAGAVTGKIGLRDTARGIPGFVVPSPYMDAAIGRDGSLWVVNPGRHLLENYRPNGDRLSAWGSSAGTVEGFVGCCNPIQMTMLDDGSFVTAEKGIVRVKVHDQTGRFKTLVAPHKAFNPGEANLDLAVSPHGQIFVLDSYGKKIRIFQEKSI